MQTLMIFWSSWLLEMVISERQQPAATSSVVIPPGTAFGSHCHMAGWGSGAHGPGRTTRVVGRPAHGANCPQLRLSGCPGLPCPNACVMAYPKLNSFGLWACFNPTEPESCSLIGLRLLPWIVLTLTNNHFQASTWSENHESLHFLHASLPNKVPKPHFTY